MLKNRFFSAALIAIACAAALTACTANQPNTDNKPNGVVSGMEEGVSDMVSDVQDGLGDKEDATHGIKPEDKNENQNQKHREAVPFGK